jgi:anaerobic selenocysteine-containing dehydrogenase
LLSGNFARRGGMNLHSSLAKLTPVDNAMPEGLAVGGSAPDLSTPSATPVGGHFMAAGLVPCNTIPEEILTDHPDRFRAMFVESANPAHSLADGPRMREALEALDLLVVIDVSMTETARLADYVLPAASQFEKWEATFFTLEFPRNVFHLRRPLMEPLEGTLPECEIHTRLVRALGAYTDADLAPLQEALREDRTTFVNAFLTTMIVRPDLAPMAPTILYETLGQSLGEAKGAAVVAGLAIMLFMREPASVMRAGFDSGMELFDAILESPSGLEFTVDDYDETWRRVVHPDRMVHLAIESLLEELERLEGQDPSVPDPEWPFVLSAGERRSFTANTIMRDPGWRRQAGQVELRINPDDAARLGLEDGGLARLRTRRGTAVVAVELSDTMLSGHVSLPNGLGLDYPDGHGTITATGLAPNELTSCADRDPIAGTPHHKHVRAHLEAVGAGESK